MATISFRLSDDEAKLIKEYVSINKLNLSDFIRETLIDRIEEDMQINEEKIIKAIEAIETDKVYDAEEVWKILGV